MNPREDKAFSLREVDECIRRGNEAVKKGQIETAYREWKKAVDIDPTRKPALEKPLAQLRAKLQQATLERARQASDQGNRKGAQQLYEKLLDFDPDDEARKESLKWLAGKERKEHLMDRTTTLAILAGMIAGSAAVSWFVYRILQ